MPKIGGKRKKTRTHKEIEEDEDITGKIPKSFIFKRGKTHGPIKDVIHDMREVMYPFTAIKFQESDKVKIKDYLKAASAYEISHFMIFTSTEKNNYLRFVKIPDGPTITFKILNYSTRKDVLSSHLNQKNFSRNFSPPLLIMNGFNVKENFIKEGYPSGSNYSLISLMIQSLFPPLNIAKANLNSLKRVVLFNLNQEKDIIYFRHYYIIKSTGNINNKIKKVLESKKIPNLSSFNDISDYLLNSKENNDDKEENFDFNEEDIENENDTKQIEGNEDSKIKTSIKLYEIGPRLKLRLFKIEEGLLKGNVAFHRLIKKDDEALREQKNKIKLKIKEKEKRKLIQEQRLNQKLKIQEEKDKKKNKFNEENEDNEGEYIEEEQEDNDEEINAGNLEISEFI